MYDYKNKAGKVIVVYDADEQIAVHVVTSLVERGYDNLFMLSGGECFVYVSINAVKPFIQVLVIFSRVMNVVSTIIWVSLYG